MILGSSVAFSAWGSEVFWAVHKEVMFLWSAVECLLAVCLQNACGLCHWFPCSKYLWKSLCCCVKQDLAVCGKDLVQHSVVGCLLCNCERRSLGKPCTNLSVCGVVSAVAITLGLFVERVQVRPGVVARHRLADRRFCGCGESKESPGPPEREVVPHTARGVEIHQHYWHARRCPG